MKKAPPATGDARNSDRASNLSPAIQPVNTEVISEAASENKRGRPKAFSDLYVSTMAGIGEKQDHCRKSQLNYCYRIKALTLIINAAEPQRFVWLFDKSKEPSSRCWKPELLTELGRLLFASNDATFFEAAEILCREKPKTKRGVEWIRSLRIERAAA